MTDSSPSVTRIGTAGWSIPRQLTAHFPGEGSHLYRYARVLPCAEINATFYRPPRPSTLSRWADSVPPGFRFSVKAPKTITHTAALASTATADLAAFVQGISALGAHLGPILFQLPPSLAFDEARATQFLAELRNQTSGTVALEPRHATWFTPEVDELLSRYRVARVAADPARTSAAALPGGWPGLLYLRLHGSPRTYYSNYSSGYLAQIARDLTPPAVAANPQAGQATSPPEAWCIFDNTAAGAAAGNALDLYQLLNQGSS